jgi:hypothetical protein
MVVPAMAAFPLHPPIKSVTTRFFQRTLRWSKNPSYIQHASIKETTNGKFSFLFSLVPQGPKAVESIQGTLPNQSSHPNSL